MSSHLIFEHLIKNKVFLVQVQSLIKKQGSFQGSILREDWSGYKQKKKKIVQAFKENAKKLCNLILVGETLLILKKN